jgi:hypothetical protein
MPPGAGLIGACGANGFEPLPRSLEFRFTVNPRPGCERVEEHARVGDAAESKGALAEAKRGRGSGT